MTPDASSGSAGNDEALEAAAPFGIEDVTQKILACEDGGMLLDHGSVPPASKYGGEVLLWFELNQWPLVGGSSGDSGVSMQCCVFRHGRSRLAEVYLVELKQSRYLGSLACLRLSGEFDHADAGTRRALMDALSLRIMRPQQVRIGREEPV